MYVAFSLNIHNEEEYKAARKIVDLVYVLRYPHEVYDVLEAIVRMYEDYLGKRGPRKTIENRFSHAWLVMD